MSKTSSASRDCDQAGGKAAVRAAGNLKPWPGSRLARIVALGLPGLAGLFWLWLGLLLVDARLRLLPYRCNRRLLAPDPVDPAQPVDTGQPVDTAQPGSATRSIRAPEPGQLQACGAVASRGSGPAALDPVDRLVWLVDIAARYIPQSNRSCLRRALVLRRCLRARGLPARLVYGAERRDGRIHTHAWVELPGRPGAAGGFRPFCSAPPSS